MKLAEVKMFIQDATKRATERQAILKASGLPLSAEDLFGMVCLLTFSRGDYEEEVECVIMSRRVRYDKDGRPELILKLSAEIATGVSQIIWRDNSWHLFTNYRQVLEPVTLEILQDESE